MSFVFLENGLSMFLWIGHNVSSQWIQQVFGVQSVAQIDIDKVSSFCFLLILTLHDIAVYFYAFIVVF